MRERGRSFPIKGGGDGLSPRGRHAEAVDNRREGRGKPRESAAKSFAALAWRPPYGAAS